MVDLAMSAQRRTLLSRIVLWLLLGLYRLKGWKLVGGAPQSRRCVMCLTKPKLSLAR